ARQETLSAWRCAWRSSWAASCGRFCQSPFLAMTKFSIDSANGAVNLTANFTTQHQLTIFTSPAGSGSVTPASGLFFDTGSVVPVSAGSAGQYRFGSWTGPVTSATSGSTTVTMTAPVTLTANFDRLPLGGIGTATRIATIRPHSVETRPKTLLAGQPMLYP